MRLEKLVKAGILRKSKSRLYHYTNKGQVEGVHPGLRGECSGLSGDCSGLSGDCTQRPSAQGRKSK